MSTPRERGIKVDGSGRHRHEHADPPSKPHHDRSPHGDEHGHGAHDKHAGHDPEMFRRLFWWNLALAVPVLVFSEQIQEWFGYSIDGAWAAWPAPVLGTVIYLWGGQPFLKGAVAEVRDRQPGMMLLIALAITVAYVSSPTCRRWRRRSASGI
jgi:Cu2+-exporting ATPase